MLPSTTTEPVPDAHDMSSFYIVLMIFIIYIIAPNGLWLTARYYKKRHEHRYKARRPQLVIFHNLFSLFVVVVYIPLHIIFFEILWDNNGTDSEWWEVVSWESIYIAVNLSLSLRVWHSFYDFQLAHYSSRQWKSILNEELWERKQPFVIRYKHILGIPFDFTLILNFQ